jgi:5'-nucleotidase
MMEENQQHARFGKMKSSLKRPKILLTNDDGINGTGLESLRKELKKYGDLLVVAPSREMSASSHSLTVHQPILFHKHKFKDGTTGFAVDGTPADCILLAIHHLMSKAKPDIIFSGINHGENLGDDVTYSGTVSGAIEGTIYGIPSVAVSLAGRKNLEFSYAAKFAASLAPEVLKKGLPKGVFLNVNVPNIKKNKIKGVEVTRQGKRIYINRVEMRTDPRGGRYCWVAGDISFVNEKGTDFEAIENRKISITPMHLDMTCHSHLDEFRKKWNRKF